jgi:hypothetical protein
MVQLPSKEHHIYCDESYTTGGFRYMVYGGIVLRDRDLKWFDDRMATWRATHKMNAELAWTSVSNGLYAEYQSLVDLYFKLRHREGLHFKAMVCDTRSAEYVAFQKVNKEIGFYKLYYYFLRYQFLPYAKDIDHSLYVVLDQRSTKYKLSDLRKYLNLAVRSEHNERINIVRGIEPRDSKKSQPLQLADVLMGAIGWSMNDMGERPNASRAKNNLAAYLAKKLLVPSLKAQRGWHDPRFQKSEFKFSWKIKRPGA